jgi:hypothetical protein
MATPVSNTNTGNQINSEIISNSQINQTINRFENDARLLIDPVLVNDPDEAVDQGFTADLYTRLGKQSLIILTGTRAVDKARIASHLAWYTKSKQQKVFRQWLRGSQVDASSIVKAIQSESNPCVILLDDLTLQTIGWQVDLLLRVAQSGHHWIIVSSQEDATEWRNHKGDLYLHNISDSDIPNIYHPQNILRQLIQSLEDERPQISALPPTLSPTTLFHGRQMQKIAAELPTPANVSKFITRLTQIKSITPDLLEEAIRQAKGNEVKTALTQWFERELTPEEQLIAIGMALLDGLFEDQFFAAFDFIGEKVWGKRYPNLKTLDYHDLGKMRGFFEFGDATRYSELRGRFTEQGQRATLIELALKGHRRHLIGAIEALGVLVMHSFHNTGSNFELFGAAERRRRIRDVVVESLSEVSFRTFDSVEAVLLKIAADPDPQLQAITAQVLVRWMTFDPGKQHQTQEWLMDILNQWEETSAREIIRQMISLLVNQEIPDGYNEVKAIRSTIVLTSGYLLQQYPPGKLPKRPLKVLRDMSRNADEQLIKRFSVILPAVVSIHLQVQGELFDWLKELTQRVQFILPVAASLAYTHTLRPEIVHTILERLQQEFAPLTGKGIDENEQENRKIGRAMVAYGYQFIAELYHGKKQIAAKYPVGSIITFLNNLRLAEAEPFVRSALLSAIYAYTLHYLDDPQVQTVLIEVLKNLTDENEQKVFIMLFLDVYTSQRKKLPGGEIDLRVNGEKMPVWIDTARPLTSIEMLLIKWMHDQNEIGQTRQVAVLSLLSFAQSIDLPEQTAIDEYLKKEEEKRRKEEQENEQQKAVVQTITQRTSGDGFIGRLLGIFRGPNWRVVNSILTIMKGRANTENAFAFLMARLKTITGDDYANIRQIAKEIEDKLPNKWGSGRLGKR